VTRHAKKTDANHAAIRDSIRNCGYRVLDLSACGNGVPDIAVMVGDEKSIFFEIKDGDKPPSRRKLTKAEEEWKIFFGSMTYTVISVEEAFDILRSLGV
jgi:hypothetical protein